jgi:hypothetical protein
VVASTIKDSTFSSIPFEIVLASESALLFVQFSDFLQAIKRQYTKCIFEVLHARVSQLRVALRRFSMW